MDKILYVIVIYGITKEQSRAWQSLQQCLQPEEFAHDVYLHDNTVTNIYLAAAYNKAWDYAKTKGYRWMVLFDADATPTSEYLMMVKEVAKFENERAVWVPILVNKKGRQLSPERLYGIPSAYNSGMLVPLYVLEEVGGFNLNYPLDSLDHRFCYDLHQKHIPLNTLPVKLLHSLSVEDDAQVSRERYISILRASRRFADETGHTTYFRIRLVCWLISRIIRRRAFVKETFNALLNRL